MTGLASAGPPYPYPYPYPSPRAAACTGLHRRARSVPSHGVVGCRADTLLVGALCEILPRRMESTASEPETEFCQQVAVLKHDLGKYVAWMSANLDDSHWQGPVRDELIDALNRDLLRTRTPQEGPPEPAWGVWDRLSAALPRPWPAPELEQVHAAVNVLRAAEPALRTRDRAALATLRGDLRTAQRTIRVALQQLHRRLQAEG